MTDTATTAEPFVAPTCDATGCTGSPAYVTNRGWLVCQQHWTPRDRYTSCRKLTPAERRRLATTGRLK